MIYEFRKIPDTQILEVKLQGTLSTELRKQVLHEASIKLNNNGYSKLLVDILETTINPNQLSFDAFPLVNVLKKYGFHPPKKLAFLKKRRP